MKKEKIKYEKPKKEKVKTIIFILTRITVFAIMIAAILEIIFRNDTMDLSRTIFVLSNATILLGATFLPSIIEHAWKIDIPSVFEIVFIIFAICALLLGEIDSFYIKFSWWDSLLHTSSGCLICCLGFVILNSFNDSEYVKTHMSPIFVCIFAFCFSVSVGAIWEVVEWTADGMNLSNMQRYMDNITGEGFVGRQALMDTMKDIILDVIGAFIIAVIGYIDLHRKKRFASLKVKKLMPIEEEKKSD